MRRFWLTLMVLPGLTLAHLALAQEPPAPRPAEPSSDQRPAPRPTAEPAAKPQEAAPETAPTEPPAQPEPTGPPVHTALRESDFDNSACLLELTLLGAEYQTVPPLTDPEQPDCGIDRPIMLTAPLPGIEIPGGAPMRCDTARQLAHWLRDFVRPASAMLPNQPRLVGLEPGTTYQCRATVGTDSAKLSEHAFGNAFDIAAFRFEDGSRIAVEPRADSGDLPEAFQRAVRGAACLYFTTVLGPGANAAHDNHLHLDIKARRGGWRLCQ